MTKKFASQLRSFVALATVAIVLLLARQAAAQAVFGQIVGNVVDPSGAAIPNATITVTDVAKGTSVTLQSNDSGQFTADHLIPDAYNVKVTASGFKSFEQNGIQVYADTSPNVRAQLAIGAPDQTIQVSAEQAHAAGDLGQAAAGRAADGLRL